MSEELRNLGPLGHLVGTWRGDKGNDVAPSMGDRNDEAVSPYREEMTFEPTGRVDNHEQILYGLRYRTTAWRIGEPDSFHEELGYWMWDKANKQVMRCFMIPRGVTVLAGGDADQLSTELRLAAECGSETYGICSNHFLDREFKTVRYELELTFNEDGSFTYKEDTILRIKGRDELFHHTDANTLRRVED
jgi:hypothetical protein